MIKDRFRRQIELPRRYTGCTSDASKIKNWVPSPNCTTEVSMCAGIFIWLNASVLEQVAMRRKLALSCL
jgi:hypothetical protein